MNQHHRSRRRTLTAVVASTVAAGALVAGALDAQAATTGTDRATTAHPRPGRERAEGRISAVDATTVTLRDRAGVTTRVPLAHADVVRAGGPGSAPAPGSVADLAVGEHVRVSEPGHGTAGKVRIVVEALHVRGTVTAVDGASVTVAGRDGHRTTVTLASDVVVTKAGASADRTALTVGARVRFSSAAGAVPGPGGTFTAARADVDPVAHPHPAATAGATA